MKYIAILIFSFLISGCNDNPAVKVETYNKVNQLFGVKYIEVKVSSIVDEVVVEDIVVNRGNCKIQNINVMNRKPIIPKQLKFGESVSVSFSGPCEASQVDVETDQGSYTVNY